MIQSTRRKAQSPVVSSGNIHALTGKARRELEDKALADPAARGTARLVLRELFGFFRGKAVCWPCNETLAEAAGVSSRTISRALKALSKIIRTVEDGSVRSRRRIVLLAHPDAAAALLRLETAASGKSRIRRTDCPQAAGQIGEVMLDRLATESVNRSSSQFPSPAIPEPEIRPSNGKRETTPASVGIPLTAHAIDMKTRAEAGDRIAQIEWDAICREMMRAVPADQIINETLAAAPAAEQGPSGVEYLARLKPDSPSADFDLAVAVLCRTFAPTDARDYRHAYEGIIAKVKHGMMPVAAVVHAFRQACLPSARNPGRVFAFNVERRIYGVPQADEMRPVQP